MTTATKYATVQWNHGPYSLNHNLDGNAQQRALREGYYGWIGEVLVTGTPSPQALIDLWMGSPPHAQILMGDFRDIGIGCREGPYALNGNTFQIATCVGVVGKRA
jgi:uncharacterized protein YkwD